MSDATDQPLGRVLLTRTWLFQAIVAGPTFVVLGLSAFSSLYSNYSSSYDFIMHLSTAIMAMGIIFIVLVQQQVPRAGKSVTSNLEAIKAGLATAMWIWLIADAIWGPKSPYGSPKTRENRIVASSFAVILLFILFYPTVYYTRYHWPSSSDGVDRDAEPGERAPLLQGQSS
ncbi:hypothetical protein GQ53DRAFT_753800 [Thozetella sp. PMI_491]|nr:hypothetical protein GQ53DRAFT_753800 [Thozetella sp. PMI_491]